MEVSTPGMFECMHIDCDVDETWLYDSTQMEMKELHTAGQNVGGGAAATQKNKDSHSDLVWRAHFEPFVSETSTQWVYEM